MSTDRQLPKPTAEIANKKINEFDRANKEVEETLTRLIEQFPQNTIYEHVLVKAAAINLLYNTWIVGITTVARHITELNIDSALDNGDTEIVGKIARVQFRDKPRFEYSFATKYCSWHRPTLYSIWDSRIDKCLWAYRSARQNRDPYTYEQNPFPTFRQRKDLWNYTKFRQIMSEFCQRYHLDSFTFKEIDKFLFQLGNEYFPFQTGEESNLDSAVPAQML